MNVLPVCRSSLLLSLALSTWAAAQDASPAVTPFTLEVKRVPPGFSKKDNDDLKLELPRQLRIAKVTVPSTAALEDALVALKRQDCDRDDSCLQQLAQKAETLYALHASIDFTLEKNVVMVGRVVSDDGQLVRRPQTVSMPKGKASFSSVAKDAMTRLIAELELVKLPSARAVVVPPPVVATEPDPAAAAASPDAPTVTKPRVDPPPPAPPMVEASLGPTRMAAYITAGAGVVLIGTGLIVFLVAKPIEMDRSNVLLSDAAFVSDTQIKQRLGVGLMAAGLAAFVVGGVLFGASPSSQPNVAVVPMAGGAAVTLGGTFQ